MACIVVKTRLFKTDDILLILSDVCLATSI